MNASNSQCVDSLALDTFPGRSTVGQSRRRWLIRVLSLGLLVASSGYASAGGFQSHASIREAVQTFIDDSSIGGADVEVSVGELDRRLKLKQCQVPLKTFWPPGTRKSGPGSVGVRCDDGKPWRLFVRVNIKVFKNIAVLKSSKVRGETLADVDLQFERKEVTSLGDRYLTDASLVSGYAFRRSVKPGAVLYLGMFKAPYMIKRGEEVVIMAIAGGIQVKMRGKAMSNGQKGAVIKVRNSSSNRVVEGEVVDKGIVKIRF